MKKHAPLTFLFQVVGIILPSLAWAEAPAALAPPTAIKLTGCPMTDYVAAMRVGSQTFQMLVDSGSTTLAVASSNCRGCQALTPRYSPGSSAHNQYRSARALYGDNSGWVGNIYSDVAGFPGMPEVPMLMASITQQNHFFTGNSCILGQSQPNAYQGILGLGPLDLALRGTNSFIQDLYQAGANPNNAFAVQLCDKGGKLWLGGYDPAAATGAPQYTAMDTTSPFYAVAIHDMQVAGQSVGVSGSDYGSAVVDTGTTELILPVDAFNRAVAMIEADPTFQREIAGNTSGWFADGACNTSNSLSQADLDEKLPRLAFTFPDAHGGTISVDAPASQSYLLPASDGKGNVYFCAGLAQGYQTILGGAFLRARITIFDAANKRIGFAPHTSCPAL